jgi:Single-strand binding protein family
MPGRDSPYRRSAIKFARVISVAGRNPAKHPQISQTRQISKEGDMAAAARSVNKVNLVENVPRDPDVKYVASGVLVAKISLATNERFRDRNDQW